jgi:hypothetical protein
LFSFVVERRPKFEAKWMIVHILGSGYHEPHPHKSFAALRDTSSRDTSVLSKSLTQNRVYNGLDLPWRRDFQLETRQDPPRLSYSTKSTTKECILFWKSKQTTTFYRQSIKEPPCIKSLWWDPEIGFPNNRDSNKSGLRLLGLMCK